MSKEPETGHRLYQCEPVTTSAGSAYQLRLIEDGEEVAHGLVSPLDAEEFGARWIEDRSLVLDNSLQSCRMPRRRPSVTAWVRP
jgi:hypothetical protein